MKNFPISSSVRADYAQAFGSHRGTDIFAAVGSPVLAVDDGDARAATDPKGGQVVFLRADDGTIYYYAHLASYSGQFPRRVTAGDELGAVGTTGNAIGKTPHLHFEVHPNGGSAVDPFPLLQAVQSGRSGAPDRPDPSSASSSSSSSASSSSAGTLLVALAVLYLASKFKPPGRVARAT